MSRNLESLGECAVDTRNLGAIIAAYSEGRAWDSWAGKGGEGLLPFEAILVRTHLPNTSSKICTVGCGAGRETFALLQMGYSNVVGVDLTEALLQVGRERAAALGMNVQFHCAPAHKLPFPDNAFEAATLFGNIYGHMCPHALRRLSLAEIARVLRPGGLLLMDVNSLAQTWRYRLAIRMIEILRLFYNPNRMERGDKRFGLSDVPVGPEGDPRTHYFRREDVPADARAAGMSVVQQTTQKSIRESPSASDPRLYRRGDLVYVLRKD